MSTHLHAWASVSAIVAGALLLLGCSEATQAPPPAAGPVCPSFVLASSGLPTDGEWRSHPAVGDVNGDGLGDIAAIPRKGDGPSVFLGDGMGAWSEASEGLKYPRGFSCGIGSRLVDLDRDGQQDLVAADHCFGVKVFRGSDGGSWVEASQGIPRNMGGFDDADVGDLDGDGVLDIVAISSFSRGFLVLAGRTDGRWEVVWDSGLPDTGTGFEVSLLDVNGDGRLDVVSNFSPLAGVRRGPTSPPAKVWLQDSERRFRPAEGFPETGRFLGFATVGKSASGADGLLFGLIGAQAGLYLFESDSGDAWTKVAQVDEGWFEERSRGYVGVDTADFDGDGCVDVVATGKAGQVWLAMGDCRRGWRLCPEQTVPQDLPRQSGWGVTAGDLNADGRPDIVAAFGGGIKAWTQSGP